MIKILRPLALFIVALVVVPWLPLFVERSMTRAMVIGHSGDVVSYGFKLRTLAGFIDDYQYMRPEESPLVYLLLNLALAFGYATALTLSAELIVRRLRGARRGEDKR